MQASYTLETTRAAKTSLNSLPSEDTNRLTEVLQDVATNRQPTNHPKCSLLNGHSNLYKIKTGDVRALARLEKPAFQILRVGHRQNFYDRAERDLNL